VAVAAATPDAPAVPVTSATRTALFVAVVAALGSQLGAQRSALPFGLKAGHHVVAGGPGSWVPRDTGVYPRVILAGDWPAALGQGLAQYLASHGFAVRRLAASAPDVATETPGDSTAVAVVRWGRDPAATATLESATPVSIRVVRSPYLAAGRLRVVLPAPGTRPGAAARQNRMIAAVTQAILNATLVGTEQALGELASRFTAAGLQGTYIHVP